ncbi:MAG TPA: hypothetical protein VGY66_34335 [Gemmataceae bacterium]|jgi:hypothetical protein|nr:hypothetical protein [Gemmataceae bacterium]
MDASRVCNHCHGTTYCGGCKDAAGNLKLRTACTTCVVKSALNPQVVYNKVVCSVCGGTGVVQPGHGARLSSRSGGAVLLVASLLCGLSIVFFVISILLVLRPQNESLKRREVDNAAAAMTAPETRAKIALGMTTGEVIEKLGEPDPDMVKKDVGEGFDSLELWTYVCADGRVQISFRDGKVQAVQ